KALITEVDGEVMTKDSDYVFLTFILNYLPHGLIGLLIAVILSAAMSSTSSEISALASTTAIDFYKRFFKPEATEGHYLLASKAITLLWGGLAILFAFIAKSSENLIEAVNIIGSIFYGTILGIFLVAFFFKYIKGTSVFYAALLAQGVVIAFHFLTVAGVLTFSYLMYNVVGCLLTILFGFMLQLLRRSDVAE
ncbi:MAG: sodium:solute symporter, partial [Bacteroidota bacterium]